MADHTSHGSAELDKLADLIEGIEIAQLATVRRDGTIHSRPMATQEMQPDGTLCFLTERDSGKVDEVVERQHVHLGYSDLRHSRYVSVSGTASITSSRPLIRELWTPFARAWFDGPEDPSIVVLQVRIEEAEYWDTPKGGKPIQLLRLATSAFTGNQRSTSDSGDHGHLDLH
ncbi:MAG: Pyridoxamine 5-phosphate oxidase [Thermoleophilia bacterium]|nr:Pyridoxamine 5-phosphate oxidase [Thermoleophilia bacterium]